MKYLNLIYSNEKIGTYVNDKDNHYDSTSIYEINYKDKLKLTSENTKVLTYKLRSNDTVRKWSNHFLNNQEKLADKFYCKKWQYNFYTTPSWEVVKTSRKKLNSIIDTINSKGWFNIDSNLKLNVQDQTTIELEKLNELHFIFENQSFETEDHEERTEIFYYLEAINNLVHLCERFTPDSSSSSEFHSYRLQDDLLDKIPMKNTDYNRMDVNLFGTVMVDFGTVGKDLGTCFYTNDIELVRRQEIKQQDFIRPFISFDWTEGEKKKFIEYDAYYEWCENNNVEQYGYDYKKPKYNLGRVILGDLTNKKDFSTQDIQNILLEFPYFVDITLSVEPLVYED